MTSSWSFILQHQLQFNMFWTVFNKKPVFIPFSFTLTWNTCDACWNYIIRVEAVCSRLCSNKHHLRIAALLSTQNYVYSARFLSAKCLLMWNTHWCRQQFQLKPTIYGTNKHIYKVAKLNKITSYSVFEMNSINYIPSSSLNKREQDKMWN